MLFRILTLVCALLTLPLFAEEPPADEEKAESARMTKAICDARTKIAAVFGAGKTPHFQVYVLPEGTALDWGRVKEGEETKFGVEVGQNRWKREKEISHAQISYDLAHAVMDFIEPRFEKEMLVREPIAMIAANGGAPIRQFGMTLAERGPLTLEELSAYYAALQAEEKTDAQLELIRSNAVAAQATNYLIGLDLHRLGHIKEFLEGKLSAEELKKKIDPAGAWERRKDCLTPKSRNQGPIRIQDIG